MDVVVAHTAITEVVAHTIITQGRRRIRGEHDGCRHRRGDGWQRGGGILVWHISYDMLINNILVMAY